MHTHKLECIHTQIYIYTHLYTYKRQGYIFLCLKIRICKRVSYAITLVSLVATCLSPLNSVYIILL